MGQENNSAKFNIKHLIWVAARKTNLEEDTVYGRTNT